MFKHLLIKILLSNEVERNENDFCFRASDDIKRFNTSWLAAETQRVRGLPRG